MAEHGFDSHVQITLVGVDTQLYICTNVFAIDSEVRGLDLHDLTPRILRNPPTLGLYGEDQR